MATRWFNDGDWTDPTFEVGKLGILASDLCNAINERERIFSRYWRSEPDGAPPEEDLIVLERFSIFTGETEFEDLEMTEWTLPDDTTKTEPTPEDFGSIVIGDIYWTELIDEIRTAIEARFVNVRKYQMQFRRIWLTPPDQDEFFNSWFFISGFVWMYEIAPPDFGEPTPGSYAAIETLDQLLESGTVGESDWIDFDRLTQGNLWLQMKEAIDRSYFAEVGAEQIDSDRTSALQQQIHNATVIDLTLDTVTEDDAIVINGLRFVAAQTQNLSEREFGILGGDILAAANLTLIINDATFGVEDVTATANEKVIELKSDDEDSVFVWPEHMADSFTFLNTAQALQEIPTTTRTKRSGSFTSTTHNEQQVLDLAYEDALTAIPVLDNLFTQAGARNIASVTETWFAPTGVTRIGNCEITGGGAQENLVTGMVEGTLLQSHLVTQAIYIQNTQRFFQTILKQAIPYIITMNGDQFAGSIHERLSSQMGGPNDPVKNVALSLAAFDSLLWPVSFPFEPMPSMIFTLPGVNPISFIALGGNFWDGGITNTLRSVTNFTAVPVDEIGSRSFRVIGFDERSGLQWY